MQPVHLHWTLDPSVICALFIYAVWYLRRFKAVRRGEGARAASGLELAAFVGACVLVCVALVSPLDGLGEDYLFSAHMAQHLLIGDIAPALFLLSLSRAIARPATRRLHGLERRLGVLTRPPAFLICGLVLVYLWHLPAAYGAALSHPAVHALEHTCFFAAGILIWWPVIQPVPLRSRLSGLQSLGYLAAAKLGLGALGLYLAWSATVAYSYYLNVPHIISALDDQRAGGALMMGEQSIVFCIAVIAVFVGMLSQSEIDQQRRERLEERALR